MGGLDVEQQTQLFCLTRQLLRAVFDPADVAVAGGTPPFANLNRGLYEIDLGPVPPATSRRVPRRIAARATVSRNNDRPRAIWLLLGGVAAYFA
jgi:hypothetical protein